ncbi:MAG: RNA polymerase sigma factor [bacterium]|nr:RNA polymerase sigma factor [Candidatus Aquidulcis frankliniae]
MTRSSSPGGGEGVERTALLAAARAGSQDAFRDLFTPDLDLAWRMALRITGSEASADDALQAGLLSAYRSLDRVAPTNLRGWFVRIVENAARDLMRRERRHPTLPFATEPPEEARDGARRERTAADPQAGADSDPAQRAEISELAAALAIALEAIPEERRRAILLYDVDGYDYAEIAELTGVSVGTIKSRISRGREELRRLLADQRPGTVRAPSAFGERDE